MTDQNGQARVGFDRDHPENTISIEQASAMLKDWRARNPSQFGYWLAAAQTGVEPKKSARAVKP